MKAYDTPAQRADIVRGAGRNGSAGPVFQRRRRLGALTVWRVGCFLLTGVRRDRQSLPLIVIQHTREETNRRALADASPPRLSSHKPASSHITAR